MQRVAVEHHDRCAREQRRDEGVPHHPGRCREPHQPVARAEIPAQRVVLEMFEEDPPVAVDDRLGQAGGARREQHAQRVVERHLIELERPIAVDELVPPDQRHGDRVRVDGVAAVLHLDDIAHRRQRGDDVGDLGAPVDVACAVHVAADDEQHRRFDLGEAVDDAAFAELGSARRPRRTEAGAGEKGGERLGDVRQVADDAVARSHAQSLQPGPRPADERGELAERQRAVGGRVWERATTATSSSGNRPPTMCSA